MPEQYKVEPVHLEGEAVLRLSGEIDLASSDAVVDAAMQLILKRSGRPLFLDMAYVTFLDSSGIAAIITLNRAAERSGGGLRIRRPSPFVQRTLEIAGCTSLLERPALVQPLA